MEKNEEVYLALKPGVENPPSYENFAIRYCEEAILTENDIIIKTLFLSVDPALRCRMNDSTGVNYMSAWKLNACIRGLGGVGVVAYSSSEAYPVGCYVHSEFDWPWKRFFSANFCDQGLRLSLRKLENPLELGKLSLPLSCTGMIGLTALIGIEENGKPQAEDTFVVSGAAGACGTLAGQIAKIKECSRIVGICGSAAKCQVLTNELGFTGAINYKEDNLGEKLKEFCPEGINVYFDNVGGEISDTVIMQIKPRGRIVLCGQISTYNKNIPYPPPVGDEASTHIDVNDIERQRFLIVTHEDKFAKKSQMLAEWYADGKLIVKETMYEGLENAGKAFVDMMNGKNIGKMCVKVADK